MSYVQKKERTRTLTRACMCVHVCARMRVDYVRVQTRELPARLAYQTTLSPSVDTCAHAHAHTRHTHIRTGFTIFLRELVRSRVR